MMLFNCFYYWRKGVRKGEELKAPRYASAAATRDYITTRDIIPNNNLTGPYINNKPSAFKYKNQSTNKQFQLINTTFKDGNGQDSILSKVNRLILGYKQKYRSLFLNTGVSSKQINKEKAIIYYLRQDRFLFINIAKQVLYLLA